MKIKEQSLRKSCNSQSGKVHRTCKVLHLKHNALKRVLRKKQSNNKMEIYETDRGASIEIPLKDFKEKLVQILSLSIKGLSSRGDGDIQVIFDFILSTNKILIKLY